MRSWPSLYLPPALSDISHPPLKLHHSYLGEIVAITDNEPTIYVCGITPYDATHLGHAATYLTFDLVSRYFLASGKQITTTQNITDIDDPLLERAKRDDVDWQDLGRSQIDLYCDDMTELHVLPPSNYLGVIESMSVIVQYIEKLLDSGNCYWLESDLYLDFKKIPSALADLPFPMEEAIEIFAERGGDPDRSGKRHPLDTLLWLGERDGEPSWKAPFGSGRPGWHIECVAIALSTLGRANNSTANRFSITLQGGGSDLKFPHHYMTGVQVRALTGFDFASIYIHTGMIFWQGAKMSKSLGNLLFVSKLLASGWSANELRLALINRNYRENLEWQDELLLAARSTLERITENLAREEVAPTKPVIQAIVTAISTDLNIPEAIRALLDWCSKTEAGATGGSAGELARALDLYLGLTL